MVLVLQAAATGRAAFLIVRSIALISRATTSAVSPPPSGLSAVISEVVSHPTVYCPCSRSAVLITFRCRACAMAIRASGGCRTPTFLAIITASGLGYACRAIATTRSISPVRGVSARRRRGRDSSAVSIGGLAAAVADGAASICSRSMAPFFAGSVSHAAKTVLQASPASAASYMAATVCSGGGRGRATFLGRRRRRDSKNLRGRVGAATGGRSASSTGLIASAHAVAICFTSCGSTAFFTSPSSRLGFAVSPITVVTGSEMTGLIACSDAVAVWSGELMTDCRRSLRYSEIAVSSLHVPPPTSQAKNAATSVLYVTSMAPPLMASFDAPSLVLSILATAHREARCMTAFFCNLGCTVCSHLSAGRRGGPLDRGPILTTGRCVAEVLKTGFLGGVLYVKSLISFAKAHYKKNY